MEFFTIDGLLNLFTLTGLEIVLGVDNIIFIALLVQNLQGKIRVRARIIGLALALVIRIIMLSGATWMMKLTEPLFSLLSFHFSGKSLLLIIGGLFLVVKSIKELLQLFSKEPDHSIVSPKKEYFNVILQIIFIDVILSFDSIITAVGISSDMPIMVTAIMIAILVMLIAAEPVGKFIYANPSIKVLALAFIGFLGVFLALAGVDIEIDKGYLYFSMLFAGLIEVINIRLRKNL